MNAKGSGASSYHAVAEDIEAKRGDALPKSEERQRRRLCAIQVSARQRLTPWVADFLGALLIFGYKIAISI